MKLKYWTYFRRGHGTYLAFILSFCNFIVLQYRLLIEYVSSLEALFGSLMFFAVIFFIIYIPTATIIGWIDYKKGSVPVDYTLLSLSDPWRIDVARALTLIAEGKGEEAKEKLRKWVK